MIFFPIYRPDVQRGFSYAEVLLSVLLLAILLVPALRALNAAVAGGNNNLAARELALRAKFEEVLADPFAELSAQTYVPGGNTTTSVSTALSDPAGSTGRRVVVLYRYDVASNALSSSDTGLLWVNVYYEDEGSGNALSTLIGRWW